MDTQLTAWLNEGLKHYAAGDHARALESWYRILEVEPEHPAALEYVSFLRDTVRLETTTTTVTTTTSARAPGSDPPTAVMPPPTATVTVTMTTAVTTAVPSAPASPLFSSSWADLLGDDLPVPPPTALPATLTPPPMPAVALPTIDAVAPVVDATPPADVAPPAPLPAPEVPDVTPEPGPPPAIARWASPRVTAPTPPPPAVSEFEPLQPFDLDAIDVGEPEPMPAERPGAGFTAPPSPPAVATPPSPPAVEDSPPPAAPPPPGSLDAAWDAAVTGPAPTPPPGSDPWASVPRTATPAPRTTDDAPAMPSPVLRPAPTGEIYRTGASVDVIPAERSAPVEERIMRQSVRYDEPGEGAPAFMAAVVAADIAARADEATPTPTPAMSPWDGDAGPAATLDLDVQAPPTTTPRVAAPAAAVVTPAAPPPTPAPPVDELEALMTGARELFALGDFSGSLELVEKVLQREPAHEGARAYLKRNETTLLKMYESKLGQLGNIPSQLVPPDEVIWLNMHHRAGFILSQVDGTLSYEDLLEVSGMDRFDTIRILADLVQNGIIGVK